MEPSGKSRLVVSALLLSLIEPWSCPAQAPAPPTSTSAATPSTATESRPDRRTLETNEPIDIRQPTDLAAFFRLPGESAATPSRSGSLATNPVRIATHVDPLPDPAKPRTAIPRPRPFGQPVPTAAPMPPEASDTESALGRLAGKLQAAPLMPTDIGLPINLATALRLSDARPLIVAAAQASVWVAEAQLTRAKVLWVPALNVGADYIRHDGGGPDFNKGILTAPSVNFFYGGAGLWQIVALTDVFFEPLVKRQELTSRQADIQTAKNDAAFLTATTYFDVHQHRGMYAGALYCVDRGRELVERIASLSNELVPIVEVERAKNLLADLEQQATASRQAWRVSSG